MHCAKLWADQSSTFLDLTHPGLQIEDDMRTLMSEEKELALLLLQDPDLPGQ
jgi:hypothetical protein